MNHDPRIAPLTPPYDPEVGAELQRWMPPGAAIEPLKLFRTLGRHPTLAQAMRPFGAFLLSRQLSLGKRVRELAIARVCARCGCEYEWGVHATAFAFGAGLTEAQLRATVRGGPDDPAFEDADRLIVRLVDELCDHAKVSDELWTKLAAHWRPEQLLELLALVGWYHVIAYVANGAGIELEEWGMRFPTA